MLPIARERSLLQGAVTLAALVPVAAGLLGVLLGPAMTGTVSFDPSTDSHFRYLSGILLALGLAFLSLVPRIEVATLRFRALTFLVVVGGLGRLVSLFAIGMPGLPMLAGLVMELGVTPALCVWQASFARRYLDLSG